MPQDIGKEPGESEFCWGKGLMPLESRGYIPTNFDKLKSFYDVNRESDNPEAVESYGKRTRND